MAFNLTYGAVALAVLSQTTEKYLREWGEVPDRFNSYMSPVGASRFGTFTALVKGTDLSSITGLSPASLVMAIGSDTVTFYRMYAGEISPVDVSGTFYSVQFVDERAVLGLKCLTTANRYNMPNPAGTGWEATTLNSGSPYTLGDIITALATAMGITITSSPSDIMALVPDGVDLRCVPCARAIDALLWTFGCVMLYDNRAATPLWYIDKIGATTYGRTGDLSTATYLMTDSKTTPAVVVPTNIRAVYENFTANSVTTVTSATGRPAAYSAGDLAVPAPSFGYAVNPTGFSSPRTIDPAVVAAAAFRHFSPMQRKLILGLKDLPLNAAVDTLMWQQRSGKVICGFFFSRAQNPYYRPAWAIADTMPVSSAGTTRSRIDPLGRSQVFTGIGESQTFLVWLTQNGGADGSDATPEFPTYTYNVFSNSAKSIQIGTAVGVDGHRLLQVAVTAASIGIAQWVGGVLHLIWVDEYFGRDSC